MRVLHTSDWHLGRKLGEHSLLGEQEGFCDWLVEFVGSEGVDLVAISGDLFDRSIPPADAITLLWDTFRRLRDAGATVAAIAGNHDSATRLAMADGFTEAGGLYLRGGYGAAGPATTLELAGERIQLVTVPFLDPHMAPAQLVQALRGEGVVPTHESVLEAALRRARRSLDQRLPSLVLAHAFVTSASPSPSERELAVGDAAMVSSEMFAGFDYVALGHLHQPQAVRENPHIRYSGSPLPYSFSETSPKSVVVLEVEAGRVGDPALVEIPVGRRVATVRGELEALAAGRGNPADWVRAELTDELRPIDAARILRANHPFLAQVEWVGGGAAANGAPSVAQVRVRTPMDLMCEFWLEVRGERPPPEVCAVMEESLRQGSAPVDGAEEAA